MTDPQEGVSLPGSSFIRRPRRAGTRRAFIRTRVSRNAAAPEGQARGGTSIRQKEWASDEQQAAELEGKRVERGAPTWGACRGLEPARPAETGRQSHAVQHNESLESVYIMTAGPTILPKHLDADGRAAVAPSAAGAAGDLGRFPTLDEQECAHIKRALHATAGHRGHAAELLGVSERSLYRLLTRHGIAA